jgi:hypothetical protein
MEFMKDYQKYRWFYTGSGKLVVGGKSAAQNDWLLKLLKTLEYECLVMHTSEPGSPFSVIISETNKVTKQDIQECAIFTACFSKAWKFGKKKASVDLFNLSQVYKGKDMKEGTWGVIGKVQRVEAQLQLVLIKQKGLLRAVPKSAAKSSIIANISPGNIEKKDIASKLELEVDKVFNQEELLSALPSGGFKLSTK